MLMGKIFIFIAQNKEESTSESNISFKNSGPMQNSSESEPKRQKRSEKSFGSVMFSALQLLYSQCNKIIY